jgi:hypothetical protein
MHVVQRQAHYAPSSVGALIDPAFLRRACNDGLQVQHTEPDTVAESSEIAPALWKRCWDYLAPAATARRVA